MTTTWKELVDGFASTGTPASAYEVPALTQTTITAASVRNSNATVAQTINVYRVPSGDSADDSTMILQRNIPANSTAQLFELVNHKFEQTTKIFIEGVDCFFNISGVENVPD